MLKFVAGFLRNSLCNFNESFWQRFCQVEMKTFHFIICFETIGFKKLSVILMIVWHFKRGMCKTSDQQSPVFVCFSEIYRSVSCLHPFCFKPLDGSIKKLMS